MKVGCDGDGDGQASVHGFVAPTGHLDSKFQELQPRLAGSALKQTNQRWHVAEELTTTPD